MLSGSGLVVVGGGCLFVYKFKILFLWKQGMLQLLSKRYCSVY